MKSAILAIPGDPTPFGDLRPLALTPMLGRKLLALQLDDLKAKGYQSVVLCVGSQIEAVQEYVDLGTRWGLKVEVRPLAGCDFRELVRKTGAKLLNFHHLWPADARGWYERMNCEMHGEPAHRIGMREVSPGVSVHLSAQVAASARLIAPVWIGANCRIGERAVVEASAIESDSLIDEEAHLVRTWVGPHTYAGKHVELIESLAWGRRLVKWSTGSAVDITDEFLLSPVKVQIRKGIRAWQCLVKCLWGRGADAETERDRSLAEA